MSETHLLFNSHRHSIYQTQCSNIQLLQSTMKEKQTVVDPSTKTTENLPCCLDKSPVYQT